MWFTIAECLKHKKNKSNALCLRFFKNFDLFFSRSEAKAFDGNGFVWRKRHRYDSG